MLTIRQYDEGHILIKPDTEMEAFYIILQGKVSNWVPVSFTDMSPVIHQTWSVLESVTEFDIFHGELPIKFSFNNKQNHMVTMEKWKNW